MGMGGEERIGMRGGDREETNMREESGDEREGRGRGRRERESRKGRGKRGEGRGERERGERGEGEASGYFLSSANPR